MPVFWAVIGWIKSAWDWFSFGDAAFGALQLVLGVATVTSLGVMLTGAWARASGYEIMLAGLLAFVAWHVFAILRILKRPKPPIVLSPAVEQGHGGRPSKWVQINVHANTDLIGCQVILRKIEAVTDDASNQVYGQPLEADWSGTTEIETNIHKGQDKRANLFAVARQQASMQHFILPKTHHPDESLRRAVEWPGLYRITVSASAHGAGMEERAFMFRWYGDRSDVEFWEPQPS